MFLWHAASKRIKKYESNLSEPVAICPQASDSRIDLSKHTHLIKLIKSFLTIKEFMKCAIISKAWRDEKAVYPVIEFKNYKFKTMTILKRINANIYKNSAHTLILFVYNWNGGPYKCVDYFKYLVNNLLNLRSFTFEMLGSSIKDA